MSRGRLFHAWKNNALPDSFCGLKVEIERDCEFQEVQKANETVASEKDGLTNFAIASRAISADTVNAAIEKPEIFLVSDWLLVDGSHGSSSAHTTFPNRLRQFVARGLAPPFKVSRGTRKLLALRRGNLHIFIFSFFCVS